MGPSKRHEVSYARILGIEAAIEVDHVVRVVVDDLDSRVSAIHEEYRTGGAKWIPRLTDYGNSNIIIAGPYRSGGCAGAWSLA